MVEINKRHNKLSINLMTCFIWYTYLLESTCDGVRCDGKKMCLDIKWSRTSTNKVGSNKILQKGGEGGACSPALTVNDL